MKNGFAFLMSRMPWDKQWTVRIVFPGMDNGEAIWLETSFKRETVEEAEAMLDAIIAALPNVAKHDETTTPAPTGRKGGTE